MTAPMRVVLIGGGYVSLFAYRSLRRAIRAGRVRVTVVSADDHHNFHGFTGEVVAGHLPYRLTRSSLPSLLPSAEFVHGTVLRVDSGRRAVVVRPAGGAPDLIVGYDQLVVGAGGREPLDEIPGLRRHGFSLRAPGEFGRFLNRLDEAAGGSEPVVIVGGGLAGVELAAAVAGRLRFQRRENGVVLVHPGADVLPDLAGGQPRLVATARRELRRLGVRVVPNTRVRAVDGGGVRLDDGSAIPAALVLATHGQRPIRIPGLGSLPRDDRARLITDPQLRVTENIWAAGDVARVVHPVTGEPVTANALWAIKAGAHLGRTLSRLAAGRRPRRFRYRGLGRAMSFGIGRSAAELYGVPICGVVGWVLRLAFFLRFMPRRRQALGVVAALASLPFRGRFVDRPDAGAHAAAGEPSLRDEPDRSAIPVQRAG